jgi:hypothetical protein
MSLLSFQKSLDKDINYASHKRLFRLSLEKVHKYLKVKTSLVQKLLKHYRRFGHSKNPSSSFTAVLVALKTAPRFSKSAGLSLQSCGDTNTGRTDVHSTAHKVIAGFFLSPEPEVT